MKKLIINISEFLCSAPWYVALSTLLFMMSFTIYLLIENHNTNEDYFTQEQIDISVMFLMASLTIMINCNIFYYVSNQVISVALILVISVVAIVLMINLKKLPIWEER